MKNKLLVKQKFKVKILGYTWQVAIVASSDMDRAYGENTVAFCTTDGSRVMMFRFGRLLCGTIRHEVFHAFMSEFPTMSATLDASQVEELVADFIANHWSAYNEAWRIVAKKAKARE